MARVKAVLRRCDSDLYAGEIQSLVIDESRRLVLYKGVSIDLTKTEFKLLKLMSDSVGQVFSRQQIIENIYEGENGISERSVDTCVKKLRRKMEAAFGGAIPIHTIYGAGYKYEEP